MSTEMEETFALQVDKAVAGAAKRGVTPTRLYVGRSQWVALIAEDDYFAGFFPRTNPYAIKKYRSFDLFVVAADDHLYAA